MIMQQNNSIKQCSISKDYSIIDKSDVDDVFGSIYTTIILNKEK